MEPRRIMSIQKNVADISDESPISLIDVRTRNATSIIFIHNIHCNL